MAKPGTILGWEQSVVLASLHNKEEIAQFLRHNTPLHLYELGDLDDFFWEHTTWYALKDEQIRQLALLYGGPGSPVLMALTNHDPHTMRELLRELLYLLPRQFEAHLTAELAPVLTEKDYRAESHGLHYKMILRDSTRLTEIDTSEVVALSTADRAEIDELYHQSYLGNWFDPRMLETNCYYGVRRAGKLVSIAGVHVYSPTYKIAVLGNITTHPAFRGQGLAEITCAKLCQSLLQTVDQIGLNVKVNNKSAIACYEKLGFEIFAEYEEFSFELK